MTMVAKQLEKIESKDYTVGVMGLGYVGLPVLQAFSKAGFPCLGYDVDPQKIEALRAHKSYILHISADSIARMMSSSGTNVTTDSEELKKCDAIIITVPTPLTANREPDLRHVRKTAEIIASMLHPGQLISLESTTYPGTTEEVLVPILETSGLKVNDDFYLAYSPEREDPNNGTYSTEEIPKVVGATSPDGLRIADLLYQQIVVRTVLVSSTAVAESTKLLENIFRAVNIAMVNELKCILTRLDIDIWEVIEAAKTKPFGFMPFYPGPGLGGHCIPIDPFYLSWKAREYGLSTRFIELAGEINTAMPNLVVFRAMEVLSGYGKPLKDANILILGLAYKPNVDDDRESPSYAIMDKLEKMGAKISVNDPYINTIHEGRRYAQFSGRDTVPITGEYDLFIIVTDHKEYSEINFKVLDVPVLDTRNVVNRHYKKLHRA